MQIELKECSMSDGRDILEMIREIGPGENGFLNDEFNMDDSDFGAYLERNVNMSNGIDLEPGWVPQTRYWLFAGGRPVGMGKLRHYLNDNLRKYGGHIGYCVRPSERGKGYGTVLLGELLKKAVLLNIPYALITCNEENTASRHVAEGNAAVLERVAEGECYYWIKLHSSDGIREIHPDDYDEIYDLWCRTPGVGLNEADSELNVRKFLLRNKGLSFCRKLDDKIIATVLCGHDGRRGYIYHVAVAEKYRGAGIGRELVTRSLGRLKNECIEKCHLFVFADNEAGSSFWENTGWTKREDLFVYSKSL